jgi:hypothetical protein
MSPKEVLTAFWQHRGDAYAEEYADALLAAYDLGDEEAFAAVLSEVATEPDTAVIWEAMTLFNFAQTLKAVAES